MAEQRTRRRQSNAGGTNGRRANRKLSGREAIDRVLEEAAELMGRPIESVVGLEPDDDGGWTVTVDVVELERIPHSTDVLGSYAITVDKSGELTGWRRRRRYYRNQAD